MSQHVIWYYVLKRFCFIYFYIYFPLPVYLSIIFLLRPVFGFKLCGQNRYDTQPVAAALIYEYAMSVIYYIQYQHDSILFLMCYFHS